MKLQMQFKKYLLWLTDTGLMDRIEKPFPTFQISKKGSEFVKMLQDSPDSTSGLLHTNEINYEEELK